MLTYALPRGPYFACMQSSLKSYSKSEHDQKKVGMCRVLEESHAQKGWGGQARLWIRREQV